VSGSGVAEHVLLAAGCAVIVLSCLGVLAADGAYERVHFQGPIAILGVPLIAVAVVVSRGFDVAGVSACLVAATLLVLAPFVTHVQARAMRVHQEGGWRINPEEIPEAHPEQEPGR
jgi:multisubunit Na+/H+ antiporter MnhG subunit